MLNPLFKKEEGRGRKEGEGEREGS